MKHFATVRTTSEFNEIYSKATKVWHNPYFVLFYKETKGYNVGFVAGKKVGNAVARNRSKRVLRANFISNIEILKEGSFVFVAKAPLIYESFETISKAYTYALKRSSVVVDFTDTSSKLKGK